LEKGLYFVAVQDAGAERNKLFGHDGEKCGEI